MFINNKTKIKTLILSGLISYTFFACAKPAIIQEVSPTTAPTQTITEIVQTIQTSLTPEGEVSQKISSEFYGQRAFEDVQYQVSLGPRTPDSQAHEKVVSWIQNELKDAGWETEIQESAQQGHPVKNVIGRRGKGKPWIILGAHYDSRMVADQDKDPQKQGQPVPGANDGASGVAVLLELARALPKDFQKQVWLVFFDVEDNGDIPGWDWILGSRAFVQSLNEKPDAAVVIDMIGDANLEIYKERNSTPELVDQIWGEAATLGYSQFKPEGKFSMLDDHTPFLQAGIPAVDIIDFDYPYWHTSEDTPDKVSPDSLKAVGDTLQAWLIEP
jgi:glutaminyl-peptide cyclotransferase